MTDEELFFNEGAYYFGNRLIYRNQDVGITAPNSPLVLTGDGEIIAARLRNIEDVEVKPVKASKKAAAKATSELDTSAIDDLLN